MWMSLTSYSCPTRSLHRQFECFSVSHVLHQEMIELTECSRRSLLDESECSRMYLPGVAWEMSIETERVFLKIYS